MASASSSLHLLSLTPHSLYLSTSKPKFAASSFLSSPLKPIPKLVSLSFSSRPLSSFSSRLTPNVALSSEFEQDEALGVNEEEPSFSPDLKVFVGNLPYNCDSATLAGLFEQSGNVEMVEVIYDKITGRSRGFGFVTMSTVREVEEAVQRFNGYELDGRLLRVNSGPPPPKDDSPFKGSRGGGTNVDNSNRVYVGNLSWGVDSLALETLFSEQGKVVEAKVVYDRDSGRSRGFGFVTYSSAAEVNSAIESLDGADLDGRAIRVSVAEARPGGGRF